VLRFSNVLVLGAHSGSADSRFFSMRGFPELMHLAMATCSEVTPTIGNIWIYISIGEPSQSGS